MAAASVTAASPSHENMDALPDELVERLFFFLRRDSDLQQLMAMHAVSRRLKRLLLAWQPEQMFANANL
mgnify:CR=1 FL=1